MIDTTKIQDNILDILKQIAPELEPETIDPKADLREELDIDSMDFLRVVVQVDEVFGIEIPEADYGKISTLEDMVAYIKKEL